MNPPATEYAAEIGSAGDESYEGLVASDSERVDIECLRCK